MIILARMPATPIGPRLRSYRRHRGLTQRRLALELGKDTQQIWRWEAGRVVPSLDDLESLAALYGVTLGRLLDHDAPAPPPGDELSAAEAVA